VSVYERLEALNIALPKLKPPAFFTRDIFYTLGNTVFFIFRIAVSSRL